MRARFASAWPMMSSRMTGSRLEVNVHVVTGSSSSMQNMVACVNRAGVEVSETVLEQLAASESVLTPDEKELGVCLVDIGGGTTDFAVFERGSLWHTGVLAVGGDHQRPQVREVPGPRLLDLGLEPVPA